MHVIIAAPYWRPHRGGIETVGAEQGRRLVQRGHRVTVVTSRLRGDPSMLDDDGMQVHRVRPGNWLESRGVPYPIFAPTLLSHLVRLLREADVLLAHSHAFLTSVYGVLAARRVGKPSVVLQHNSLIEYKAPFNALEWASDRSLGWTSLKLATRRLAVSEVAADYVRSIAPGPVTVFRNGVDTQRFSPLKNPADRISLRATLEVPTNRPLVFTVRRLSFKNGVDTLLEAAAHDRGRSQFVIAGVGPDRPLIERFIAEQRLSNVRLLGFVSDEALPNWYRASDVFVLPSKSGEGMPMVILEAFASGTPVIATRAGGQTEMITDQTGWLIPPADPLRMAEAIQLATASREKLSAMCVATRRYAEELDWDQQVTQLEAILNELILAK